MGIQERTFQQWKTDDIRFDLKITERKQCSLLDDWLTVSIDLTTKEKELIRHLITKGENYIEDWNEQELQTKFITPITEFVDFDNLEFYFSAFAERTIEAKYNNFKLKGKVDWMVALGKSHPRNPFFFIHVPIAIGNKKLQGTSNDAKAQLIVSMITARVLNAEKDLPNLFNTSPHSMDNMPIYGCYIIGRLWHFVVLNEDYYCVSKPVDALTEKNLARIIAILKKQKNMIINRLEEARKDKEQ